MANYPTNSLLGFRFLSCSFLGILLLITMAQSQSAENIAEIWERKRLVNTIPSNLRHSILLKYLEELKAKGVRIQKVGESAFGRSINQIEWGKGPIKVFLWSQMHGDEPTATAALLDLFNILQLNAQEAWVKQISERLTIRAVPMLNPDGAELFVRRSSQGIDINRDALDLATPEARLLKSLRDEWQPEIGFNLHNQHHLTTVGNTIRQAAISFLVVFGDEKKTLNDGLLRNKYLAAGMIESLEPFIRGHIAKYDDEFTATAFGDNFSKWGTPVILIETGALAGKDESFLVKMNVIAIVRAFSLLANEEWKSLNPAKYDELPENSSGKLLDVVFRNVSVIDPFRIGETKTVDIGIIRERRRAELTQLTSIRRIGDLRQITGLEEYNAAEFYFVGRFQPPAVGAVGEFLIYKKNREVNWTSQNLEDEFPPDAIYSTGKWVKGENLVPRLK